jgi:pyridoxamine 5'-phosphate oxidase
MSIFNNFSSNPIDELKKWYEAAKLFYEEAKSPIAFDHATLCTVNAQKQPTGRIILVKDITDYGPVFYTNYESRKGQELALNPKVALVLYWGLLGKQARVEGTVEKLSLEDSDKYFHSRPRLSQVGAHASKQSSLLANKSILKEEVKKIELLYQNKIIPRPAHWGGYLIRPTLVEFWIDGEFRLHDRLIYELKANSWEKHLVYP